MLRINGLKSVFLAFSLLFQTVIALGQITGDVSGDNMVDASDYMMLKYIAIGSKKETRTSDINGNGKVNVEDLLILENYIYKNGPDPPARGLTAPKYPVQLTPGIVDLDKKTMEILLSSEEDIGAFQFDIQGIGEIVEVLEGRAKDKDFTILSEGTRVLGVIGKGRPILSGESMLLKIRFSTSDFEQACIFEPVVLTIQSSPYQVQLGECIGQSATAKGLDDLSAALISNKSLDPKSDLNHDGYVDINDLILLENFLFRDGPPPPGSKTELSKKVKLSIENVDLETRRILVRANYSRPISGLQMYFSGIANITEVASEKFETNGFTVSHQKNKLLVHIGEGFPLLPAKGVLFEVIYDEAIATELCIGNPIISNPEGSPYVIVLGDCESLVKPVPGCMDSLSLTYNPLATVEDGSCTYPPKPPKPPKPVKEKPIKEVKEEIAMVKQKEKEEKPVKVKEEKVKSQKVKEEQPVKTKDEKVKKEKEEPASAKATSDKKVKKEQAVKDKIKNKEEKEAEEKAKAEEIAKIKAEEEKKKKAIDETFAKEQAEKKEVDEAEKKIEEEALAKKKAEERATAEAEKKADNEAAAKAKEIARAKKEAEVAAKAEAAKSMSVNEVKKGVMVPIVTTEERTNLSDLRKGTMVYDSDVQGYVFYDGKRWKMVGSTVDKSPKKLFKKIPILGLWLRKKGEIK